MFACQGSKCKPEQENLRNKSTRHKTGPGRGSRARQSTSLVPSDSGSRPFPRRGLKPNRGRRGERFRHKSANKMSKPSQPAYVPIAFAKHF